MSGSIVFHYPPRKSSPPKNPLLEGVAALPLGPEQKASAIAHQRLSFYSSETLSSRKTDSQLIQNPFSDEELANLSLLKELHLSPFPDISEMMHKTGDLLGAQLCVAANFLGGGLITGGEIPNKDRKASGEDLDGFFPLPNYVVWQWLMENIYEPIKGEKSKEAKVLRAILRGLEHLKNYLQDLCQLEKVQPIERFSRLEEMAMKYSIMIHELRPGQSLPFSGGWSNEGGGSGHEIIYEFTRKSAKRFNIKIWTSTGYQLADSIFSGGKSRIKPLILYQGVSEEDFLFNKDGKIRPVFLGELIKIRALKKWDNNQTFDEEDVLQVFDCLQKYWTSVPLGVCGAPTTQQGGACVPSVTKKWIRKTSLSLKIYKPLIFLAKLYLIIALNRDFLLLKLEDSPKGTLLRTDFVALYNDSCR